jgi:hypothetical protein
LWAIIVLIVLVSLLLLFVLALCIPFDAELEWDSSKTPRVNVRLVWLFGLFRFTARKREKPAAEPAPEKKAKRKPKPAKFLKILRVRGLFRKIMALVKSCLRQLKVRDVRADIKLLSDDPADVGLLYAIFGAAYPVFRLTRLRKITIEPVLGEQTAVEGSAHAVVRLQPVRLIWPSLKFIFSPQGFALLKIAAAR